MVRYFFKGIKSSRAIVVSMFLLMMSYTVFAADINVRTDRNPVGLNESFSLIYETSGSVDADPNFSPLETYLDILNQSQNSNISIINGEYSSKKSWRLTVMARQIGEVTLPPISFGDDVSPSYKLSVKKASDNPQADAEFFSRITVDQKQVYVQQQLVVTQQIFSARNLSAYGMGELSFKATDVVTESLGDEKQFKTQIGDKTYLVVEKRFAIYPQKSGKLELQPVLAEAQLNSGSSSFFGSFGSRGKVLRARSNALEVDVLEVPPQVDMNPWLPASNLELMEKWPEKTVEFMQGEPLTRTISLKAEGLTAAQLPLMPVFQVDGLKQYPDQPLLNDIKNDNGITGYRVEKVAFIPTRPGKVTLPAIEIPWWNTVTNSRQVARIPAHSINVVASPQAVTTLKVPNLTEPKSVEPIIQSKPEPALVAANNSSTPYLWQIMTLIFALGWVVTLLAWFLRSRKLNNPDLNKSDISVTLKKHYQALASACDEEDAAACRMALALWTKAMYADQGAAPFSDLLRHLPEALRTEIRHIDGRLYGGQREIINFTLIRDQAKKLMQQQKIIRQQKPELLEPMYR